MVLVRAFGALFITAVPSILLAAAEWFWKDATCQAKSEWCKNLCCMDGKRYLSFSLQRSGSGFQTEEEVVFWSSKWTIVFVSGLIRNWGDVDLIFFLGLMM